MKIGVWSADLILFAIYFFTANILKYTFGTIKTIIIMFFLIILGYFLRNQFIVKPYNNYVDFVNKLEEKG